jgi:predicted HAD superfamily Cof-like phosphohydrolase
MGEMQDKVRDFQAKLGQPTAPAAPAIRDGRLHARCVLEEAVELAVGLCGREPGIAVALEIVREVAEKARAKGGNSEPDIVEAVDGVIDVVYTALGAAEALGVELDPYFEAVHAANMAKESRAIDGHGKRGYKPAGWVDPKFHIAKMLEIQAFEFDVVHSETLDSIAASLERRGS